MLTLLLFGVAFALDLSATTTRAQSLQNAADAAALGGVQALRAGDADGDITAAELQAAQDAAEAAAIAILVQNGVDLSKVTPVIAFPNPDSSTEVRVTLTEAHTGRLLDGITGNDSALVRSATAAFESCGVLCTEAIDIPGPPGAILADGTGDGWLPLIVGERTYAINHHLEGGQMLCVDSSTQDNCWAEGGRTAYADGVVAFSPDVPSAAVVDEVIYWAASYAGGTYVFCWNAAADIDMPCASPFQISNLSNKVNPNNSEDFSTQTESVGGLIEHEGRLYIFSTDNLVMCVRPEIPMSKCPNYDFGGNESRLAELNFPPTDPHADLGKNGAGVSADRAFAISDPDENRIYWSTEIAEYVVVNIPPVQIVDPSMNVDQSSTDYNGAPERAIDGSGSTHWSSGSVSHTDNSFQPWWQIDLGGQTDIDSVKLFNRTDSCCRDRLDRFYVFVDDQDMTGRSFNDLVNDIGVAKIWSGDQDGSTSADWGGGDTGAWNSGGDEIWEADVGATGRYMRVQLVSTKEGTGDPDPEPLSLAEVQVFTKPGGPDASYDIGTWLQCWDTSASGGAPCVDFVPARMSPINNRYWGRTFFQRSTAGDITGVCMFVHETAEVPCVHPETGADIGEMTDLATQVQAVRRNNYNDFMGEPFEIPELNRLYFPASYANSTMLCWDFTAQDNCGTRSVVVLDENGDVKQIKGNDVYSQDYGYAQKGDCVFALGHRSYFWSFKASDTGSDCDTGESFTPISPCRCGGDLYWGTADFEIDLDPYLVFDIRILDSVGVQLWPENAALAHSLIDDGKVIPLDAKDQYGVDIFPITDEDDELWVHIFVQTKSGDQGAIGEQQLLLSFGDQPHLSE